MRKRPEPVIDAQKITAAVLGIIGGVTTLMAIFGVVIEIPDNASQVITSLITSLFTVAGVVLPLLQANAARDKVTPIEDPRDAEGNQLVPVVTAQ